MRIDFSSDELILALVSMVRAIDPGMLRQGAEGFEVDFQALEAKKEFSPDENLLLKLRAALEGSVGPVPSPSQASQGAVEPGKGPATHALELAAGEARRLVETLERLESLQHWPADVLAMSRNLRARLATVK